MNLYQKQRLRKTYCCLITRTHVMQCHRTGIPARWSPRLPAHVLSSIGCSLCYFDLSYIVISRRSKSYPGLGGLGARKQNGSLWPRLEPTLLLSTSPDASAENWKTLESPESPRQNGLQTFLRQTSFLNSRSFSLGEKTPQATFFAYEKIVHLYPPVVRRPKPGAPADAC